MKNVYRTVLTCLYLLQLAVILHGAVLHLMERVDADGDQTQKTAPTSPDGFLSFFTRAFSQPTQLNKSHVPDQQSSGPLTSAVRSDHSSVEEVQHKEHKDRVRRQKRTPLKEYLIANLFGAIRRFLPAGTAPDCSDSQIVRVLLFTAG